MADLAATRLDQESHLMLDQPLLRLPHELLRKNLKTAQRNIEMTHKSVTTTLAGNSKSADDALTAINATLAKAQTLKRKLEALQAEERNIQKSQRTRIQHLQELYEMQSLTDVRYETWSHVRLDRLLVDYLLRQGYTDAGKELARMKNVEDLVDVDVFREARRIEDMLRKGEMKDALSWCSENKTTLKKVNSELEMQLRLQQYIEMLREDNPERDMECLVHARKYLAVDTSSTFGLQASGLLAYSSDTDVEPYMVS